MSVSIKKILRVPAILAAAAVAVTGCASTSFDDGSRKAPSAVTDVSKFTKEIEAIPHKKPKGNTAKCEEVRTKTMIAHPKLVDGATGGKVQSNGIGLRMHSGHIGYFHENMPGIHNAGAGFGDHKDDKTYMPFTVADEGRNKGVDGWIVSVGDASPANDAGKALNATVNLKNGSEAQKTYTLKQDANGYFTAKLDKSEFGGRQIISVTFDSAASILPAKITAYERSQGDCLQGDDDAEAPAPEKSSAATGAGEVSVDKDGDGKQDAPVSLNFMAAQKGAAPLSFDNLVGDNAKVAQRVQMMGISVVGAGLTLSHR